MSTDKPLRILLGPWDKSLEWLGEVEGADIICFGAEGAPLPYKTYQDSITDLLARLPDDWQPEVLVLWQPHMNAVPLNWQTLNIPTFAVLIDWQLLGVFDGQLDWLRAVDGIFLDRGGVDYLRANGFQNVWPFLPSSFVPALNYPDPAVEKIYDISFAGALAHPIHRQRGQRLNHVAQNLGSKYRLAFFDWALKPAQYARVIQQSRIVFNYSYRGELNIRCYEAMAGGALLFLEDTNLDMPGHFEDGVHYVSYNDANCLEKLEYYLTHEAERQKIAQAGAQQVQQHTNAAHLSWLVKQLKPRLVQPRQANPAAWTLRHQGINYAINFYSPMTPVRAEATRLVWEQARLSGDDPAWLDTALGSLAFSLAQTQTGPSRTTLLTQAAQYLQHAIAAQPEWAWPRWALGYVCSLIRQPADAIEHLRRAIGLLQTQPRQAVSHFGPYLPYAYDYFLVAWLETNIRLGKGNGDRVSAWATLLEAQCHSALAKIYAAQDNLPLAETALRRAIQLRPDIDDFYLQLAGVLADLKEFSAAAAMVEQSLTINSLSVTAWFSLSEYLLQSRQYARCQSFCDDKLALIKSFPGTEKVIEKLEAFRQQAFAHQAGETPLTSIILLTHNQLEHTQLCLQSIEQHTPEPHELIIVDNASTDGSLDYLYRYQAGRPNVRVVSNRENLGFAAGNNQGLALAKGDYLLLLNNDTIVTAGWLGHMLAVFNRHPDVGLVGPVTNNISGPQKIETSYQTPAALSEFAARWTADHPAQSQEFIRVVGFCLLARRAVIDRIGGLDERYGSGNFEDDDFCLRAAAFGYKARIALDSFVHHTGSQTFRSMGIDYSHSLNQNWALFKAKWGIPPETPYGQNYLPLVKIPADLSLLFVPLPEEAPVVGTDIQPITTTLLLNVPEEQTPAQLHRFLQNLAQALPAPETIAICLVGAAEIPPTPLPITIMPQPPLSALAELLASSTKNLLLLSTDVDVTENTLPALLAVAQTDAAIAVVGPVSTAAPAAQRVPGPESAADLLAWAEALYLGGFCLLLKSHAVKVVGGLNPALSLAEALLDLFARLRNFGFKRAVAQGVYVPHAQFSHAEGNWYDDFAALQQQISAALAPGQAALDNGDAETAAAEFARAAFMHPDLAAVHVAHAQALQSLGRDEQAISPLRRAIELVPQEASLHRQLGDTLAKIGQTDAAIDSYFQAAALDKSQPAPLLRLAEIYRARQQYQSAAEVLKIALDLVPDNLDVLAAYGLLMLDIGDIEGAEMAWERLGQAPTNHPDAASLLVGLVSHGSLRVNFADLLAHVEALQKAENWTDAVMLLKNTLKQTHVSHWLPADVATLWNRLGYCYFNLGHRVEAGVAFERALALAPNDLDCLSNAASFYAAQEQYDLATEYVNRVMKLAPNDVGNLLLFGDIAIKLGVLDTALMAFQKVQGLAPETEGIDEIVRELKAALSDEPVLPPFDLEAALAPVQLAQSNGDWPRAKALLLEVMAHPAAADNPLLWNQLGLAHYLTDDLAAAETAFQRALALEPQNVDALSNLADLYIRQEKYDLGTEYLNRALAIRPDEVNLLLSMGSVAVELGVFDAALLAYQKVQRLAPDTAGIAEVIAQLTAMQ